ncbi:MAG: hypothetical protein M3N37_04540 [Actinomycetota bacterium]|nr:hypothetical protein [Actinomycetota bacterium]
MTGESVRGDGMRDGDDFDDEVLAALRQGRAPEGRRDLEALASLFFELRAVHDDEPVPPMAPDLRELVRTLKDDRPTAEVAAASSSPSPARRVKLLVGAALASLGLVGGLGAAGALPAPVQRMVASTAQVIGVDFPRPPASPLAAREDPAAREAPDGREGLDGREVPAGQSDAPARAPAPTTTTICPTPTSSPALDSPGERASPSPAASPGDGSCRVTSTLTSSPTTTLPGPTTAPADGSTTTTTDAGSPPTTTTERATTSTSSPADS